MALILRVLALMWEPRIESQLPVWPSTALAVRRRLGSEPSDGGKFSQIERVLK